MGSTSLDDRLWNDVVLAFPILGELPITHESVPIDPDQWRSLVYALQKNEMCHFIEDLVVEKIEESLRNKVAKEFWREIESESCVDGFDRFKKAVMGLARNYVSFLPYIEKLEAMRNLLNSKRKIHGVSDLMSLLKILIRSTLHSQLPMPKHLSVVEDFYKLSFKVFYYSDKTDRELNESGEDLQCGGCSETVENCKCDEIITDFHNINRILIQLELLERLAGEVLTSLIHKQIESHVQETCKGSFDVSFIAPLEKWLDSVVVGWLTRLYSSGPECPVTQEKLNTFNRKLHHLLYETYTRTRIDQLFTIIIEYPDSDAAIDDLKVCLEKTDLRPFLTAKLTAALQSRLLHPGVNTPDIITAYIASIRALRHLDPTGILLETCTKPVRQYLRGREDTMRCVVMSLTDEGPGDLVDELVHGEESNQENPLNWEQWNPDPIDASDAKENKERQSWDIISMLVNVYGSKEIFVHEYRNLLADRLLVQYSYNTEKEVRYLELLKLRFGDSQLHYCEVMLKDVYDSKRLNTHLHSEPNFGLKIQEFEVTCMILSAQFWPVFKEEKLELPQKIKEHLDVYTKAYETIKGNRTLSWKPHLGSVNLDIELKGRTVNLTVTPTHAAIIWYFQEKDQWTIDELSSVLHIPPTVLRRRIAYWQSQGLLKEVATDTFLLVEESSGRSAKNIAVNDMMCEDDETESIMASAQDQREEELQVFWSYIVGMLTNLESLPPDRIHMMLKMFASQGPSAVECSLQQLKHFLDRKVREHKLLFSGGFYRLPK
uniref:Anaphase-promoting complex subunit 2 n=1 Tax=Lygus hesperus TaxID=30085 RepID=A0A0A9Y699_LYGHE